MTITAIIPVRAGSRRLPNKNIAPFAGTTLLQYKIRQLLQVAEITNIIVSSDSDQMLDLANQEGVGSHKRALEYCDERTRTFGEVVKHICENVIGTDILWACCTSPLVEPDLYRRAVKEYLQALVAGYDSLMSVESFKRYLWNANGPVNYRLGVEHVPSQELPEYYIVSDGILMAPRLDMISWSYFHGFNPYRFVIGKREATDIDDVLDLEKAKAWYELRIS